MKPYTFVPQLIDSSPKTDRYHHYYKLNYYYDYYSFVNSMFREVVDRLHNWYKERDDKIERQRIDNQVSALLLIHFVNNNSNV